MVAGSRARLGTPHHLYARLLLRMDRGVRVRSSQTIARKTLEYWRALRQTRIGAFGSLGALLWKNLSKLGQFR